MEELGIEDLVHNLTENLPDDEVEDENTFVVLKDSRQALQETPFVAYESSLLQLAPQLDCSKCRKMCTKEVKRVGSAIVLVWVSESYLY